MALMLVKEYRDTCFSKGSAPDPRTVRKWVDKGEIYGETINGRLYIDPEKPPKRQKVG